MSAGLLPFCGGVNVKASADSLDEDMPIPAFVLVDLVGGFLILNIGGPNRLALVQSGFKLEF